MNARTPVSGSLVLVSLVLFAAAQSQAAEPGAAEPASADPTPRHGAAEAPESSAPSPSTAPAAAPAPAETAPAPAAAPAPTSTPATATAKSIPPSPPLEGTARVHLAVDYGDAWLELRSHVDATEWKRVCRSPCDSVLHVDGMEARVSAPGMTTSNVFRLEPGHGTARFRVDGGSSRARSTGLILMIGGVPVSLGGFTLLGLGRVEQNDALQIAGVATLGVGALSVLISLPLLISGSTTVRDAKGDTIAGAMPAFSSF